jgi:hypothetical protein
MVKQKRITLLTGKQLQCGEKVNKENVDEQANRQSVSIAVRHPGPLEPLRICGDASHD